ncbi:MAG: polynucleotide adenylyltransferase PcnB [Gammaproteobacteria bacterium]|nr:polynucleotide adenylyltransferase PcnB [Gammaproteobacteria bacterium]
MLLNKFAAWVLSLKTGRDIEISDPVIIPRPEHCVSRSNVSESALKVLYRLKKGGHEAYLVGGCVRDLLLERIPKDFDVATDASPEQVKELFRNCRLIGRRFRLAHVRFGREIVEVATFRAPHDDQDEQLSDSGRVLSDNVYGTRETDAARRDFTINSMYYDIRDFSVLDFANGLEDLRAGLIRMIGDPLLRYREDPVRMLRALRFAAKLDFELESETHEGVLELGYLLEDIPAARLFDECLKLFLSGHALASFDILRKYELFDYLFPQTEGSIARAESDVPLALLRQAMINTDERIAEGKPVTPGFLFAALLWEPVRTKAEQAADAVENNDQRSALEQAIGDVFAMQTQQVSVPRRFSTMAREIWMLQSRLEQRRPRDIGRLVTHPRFRAAYDFLVLRGQAGEPGMEALGTWWTEYQTLDQTDREKAISELPKDGRKRRPRRRKRPLEQQVG